VIEKQPNVVVIVSDQQRADTIPFSGTDPRTAGSRGLPVETPHLDWLAAQSTVFRRGYCVTPMCTPARATLLSGLYPHTTGMVANHTHREVARDLHFPANVPLLADYLKPLGYTCAYTGKWHLGTGSDRRGFDDFTTRSLEHDVDEAEDSESYQFLRRLGEEWHAPTRTYNPADFDMRTNVGSSRLPLAWHESLLHARRSAQFIHRMAGESRPFCLVYSCFEPHRPFVCPRPFDRMYDPGQMPLPQTLRDEAGVQLLRHRPEWQLTPAAQFSEDELCRMRAAYCGAVSYVDHLVGTILAALIETDQWNDTLLVFTSDHGEMLGAHGLLLKGALFYEELVNVPFLVRPPGGLSGPHVTDRLVTHADLVPTLVRWCGGDAPAALHGQDIRALAEGDDEAVHEGVALEYHSCTWSDEPAPLRGWRTEEWKYVETIGGDDELYDLRSDPQELRNLVHEPAAGPALTEMRAGLRAWLRRTGDAWPEVAQPPSIYERPAPIYETWPVELDRLPGLRLGSA
jgi:arylsulfatase A-like enzyme